MNKERPSRLGDRITLSPNGYEEWQQNWEQAWVNEQVEKYSQPATPLAPYELQKRGYQPIEKNRKTYFAKKLGNDLELILLDEQGREKEHWLGHKDVLETSYDEDGYVSTSTHLRGNGWGKQISFIYEADEEGKKKLIALASQEFRGNPTKAWEQNRPVRGENIGEKQVLNLS